MRIGVVSTQVPFMHGGAEVHARNLVSALQAGGHEAELISLPFKWYPPQAIVDGIAMARLLDLAEANGRVIDRLIGLKFPAYLAQHPCKVLWILHQHRTAYDLWDHPQYGDLSHYPDGQAVRDVIRFADNTFIPKARAVFANSRCVADRLWAANAIKAEPLYHPPGDPALYRCAPAEDFLFFPSRLMPLKRQGLVIAALSLCRQPVRVVFAGAPEDAAYAAGMIRQVEQAGLGSRVVWKGFVSDAEKLDLYARCLGVVYPPVDEDYGYVTLEAMLSGKPVVTVTDAGGPLEFVTDAETGFVAAPEPAMLAEAMDRLWEDRQRAAALGQAGRAAYHEMAISWERVVDTLTSA